MEMYVFQQVIHAYLHLLTRERADIVVFPSFTMMFLEQGPDGVFMFFQPEVGCLN